MLQHIYTWNTESCPPADFQSGETFRWAAVGPRLQVRTLADWPWCHLSSQAAALSNAVGKTMPTPTGKLDHLDRHHLVENIRGNNANPNFISIQTKVSHSTYKSCIFFHVSLLLQTITHPYKYSYSALQDSSLFWHMPWTYILWQWEKQVKPSLTFHLWVIKDHGGFTCC